MTCEQWSYEAMSAFDKVVASSDGFRTRQGQSEMAKHISEKFSSVDLGEHQSPHQAIAVIQAGTGVGKSAAYASTMITLALAKKTRLVISTATVALQEQLMTKDLPALAKTLPTPFVFALAKGRGRYVCKLKLERFVGLDGQAMSEEFNDLFEQDLESPPFNMDFHKKRNNDTEVSQDRRMKLYDAMAGALSIGQWDGDRDSLAEQPLSSDWSAVAAERHSCTARHCPRYKECSYYTARSSLVQADVIVANHDLVLSSLGMKALPDLNNCLVVFDEGHHLPAVALAQFSNTMDLSNLRWLDKLPKTLAQVSEKIGMALIQDVQTLSQQLKNNLGDVARLLMDRLPEGTQRYDAIQRFKNGVLPDDLQPPLNLIHGLAKGISVALEALGAELKLRAKEDPTQAVNLALLYAQLGQLAPRLNQILSTSSLWLTHGEQPLAKWFSSDTRTGLVVLAAHACPIAPGDLLRHHLWGHVRGALITSASLMSCGSFDYFLEESGLSVNEAVSTLSVSSPFDYSTQGRLTVVLTNAAPKDVTSYTNEMVDILCDDLSKITHGALVLFTSRIQMQVAVERLPDSIIEKILVQGQMSRTRLLAAHTARIEAGLPSVIFGMQSFGEGLDLPGKMCETVFITKLPFSPPSDPVEEARGEWLKSLGRDPFSELVVPATGMKLLQWTGRAIRTEEDIAQVICYDRRLIEQRYGRQMIKGLPPYALYRRIGHDLVKQD